MSFIVGLMAHLCQDVYWEVKSGLTLHQKLRLHVNCAYKLFCTWFQIFLCKFCLGLLWSIFENSVNVSNVENNAFFPKYKFFNIAWL